MKARTVASLGLLGLAFTASGCFTTGFWVHPADTGGNSGYSRYISFGADCSVQPAGECRTAVAAVHWGKGEHATGLPATAYGRRVGEVRAYRRSASVTDASGSLGAGLFESCYGHYCAGDSPSGGDSVVNYELFATTRDTNGDGWVSGGRGIPNAVSGSVAFVNSPTCNLTWLLVVWFAPAFGGYPELPPNAAGDLIRWRDTTVCSYLDTQPGGPLAQTDNPYSSSVTEVPGVGSDPDLDILAAPGGIAAFQQNPAGLDGLFALLPWERKLDLVNSINPETDFLYVNEGGKRVAAYRLHVTNVRVGNRSFTPVGVHFEVRRGANVTQDFTQPGWRMLQAWMATQIEDFIARGGKTFSQLRWSVTFNDAVTITSQELPQLAHTAGMAFEAAAPTKQWVDDLRRNASLGRAF